MSNYTKTTDFESKDALSSGDPNKIVKGQEIDDEFDAIATMSATKADKEVPTAANNVALLDGTGNLADGGKGIPSGAIVGTTDTQTLTNKTISTGSSLDADVATVTNIKNADIKSGAAIDAAKIHDGSVSNTEFGYLNGVTSAIQTQLAGKLDDAANEITTTHITDLNVTTAKLANTSVTTAKIANDAIQGEQIDWGGSVTNSSYTVGTGGQVLPEGFWHLWADPDPCRLEVYVNGGWRGITSSMTTYSIWSDGTTTRLRTDASTTTVYYRRWY